MVIDSSAVLAILLGEKDAEYYARAIADDPKRLMSVFSKLEAAIVIEAKKGEAGGMALDALIHRSNMQIVSLDDKQCEIARSAWRKYGKGRHGARLNIGDCCSYALSRYSGEPLLFKGRDFAQTDMQRFGLKKE
jgi:ribonuclease VapC